MFHQQLKGWKPLCMIRKEVQKSHWGMRATNLHWVGRWRKSAASKVEFPMTTPTDSTADGQLEELLEQAKFAEHFERGGVHGVAGKSR